VTIRQKVVDVLDFDGLLGVLIGMRQNNVVDAVALHVEIA
jgi:hypothetical protein